MVLEFSLLHITNKILVKDLLKHVQMRTTKTIRVMEHLSCEERFESFRFLEPGEEKALGRPHCTLSIHKGAYKKDGESFLQEQDGGNDFKLKENRCRLDIRRKFFHSVGGEALEQDVQRSCGFPVIKVKLDEALSNLTEQKMSLSMAGVVG